MNWAGAWTATADVELPEAGSHNGYIDLYSHKRGVCDEGIRGYLKKEIKHFSQAA